MLVDYGGVLQQAIDRSPLTALAGRLGVENVAFEKRFHRGRREFDRGQPTEAYWAAVVGRDLSAAELADATAVDLEFWSQLDPVAVTATKDAAAAGLRVALLSNMPHPEADAYEQLPWTIPFERLFFSCRLGLVKPDPAGIDARLCRGAAELAVIVGRLIEAERRPE